MRAGDRVGQRYMLEAQAGAGGMGVVYRARDLATQTTLALKILRTADETGLRRFRREAEILARLRHPNVVRYDAHGETAQGEAFIAMEWLEGESLRQHVARRRPTAQEVIDIGRGLAGALVAAHALNVIHRDVKPANIFLVGGSTAGIKLLDLGVARLRGEGNTLTETGAAVGTPAYMSPEQASAEKDVDARSDLFSMGSVLYYCLSGKAPFFDKDPVECALKVIAGVERPLRDVAPHTPPRLAELVHRLLQKDREKRPATAREVCDELAAIQASLQSNLDLPEHGPQGAPGKTEHGMPTVTLAADAPRESTLPFSVPTKLNAPDSSARPTVPMETKPRVVQLPMLEGAAASPAPAIEAPVVGTGVAARAVVYSPKRSSSIVLWIAIPLGIALVVVLVGLFWTNG